MILLIWISITTKKYALRLQIIAVGSCHQHNQTRFIVWLSESELTITILARRRRSSSQLNPYLMHSSPPNPLAWRQGSSWTFSIGQKTKRRSCQKKRIRSRRYAQVIILDCIAKKEEQQRREAAAKAILEKKDKKKKKKK